MKGIGRTLFNISIIAVLMLLYVHEQIALFRISYKMDNQAEQITQKSEEYRRLKYEVDQLKSPGFLEKRMEELNLDLGLPEEVQVVRIPQIASAHKIQPETVTLSRPGRLFHFLGRWVGVAQAKTDR